VTTTRDAAKNAAEIASRTAVAARTEELFRRAGALREGHFRLKSGRHSDRYLEKFQVLQFPEITSELCGMLAAFGRDLEGRAAVDVVAGPTTGGVILAFETARQLGVRSLFAEEVRDGAGTHREFRRGFTISPGERVLLVDDILTTGGSLAAMLPAVERFGGEIIRAVVLVDRSGGQQSIRSAESGRDYQLEALWRLELPTWEAGPGCPACAANLPLEEPGSGGTVPT
jgi:orotate phosphoribosyltransferase